MEIALPPRYAMDTEHPILGEGGMGRVIKAQDIELDVPVALKVVRPDLASDKRFRKLFDLEVRIAARFTHPHIVPLHDVGELADGTPFLGLALADAGSFASIRPDTPWEELLRLVLELLDALSHLHAREVLHRDLKPENVLLYTGDDGKKHVWLADLGLANAATALAKKKGRMEGTPGFMAPEQRLGLPRDYGPWTDLYSVGVILWELVTGGLPYPTDDGPLKNSLPPLVPRPSLTVPSKLRVVLANLLAAEPLSRYDLAADLRTELQALGPPVVEDSLGMSGGTVAPAAPTPSGTAAVASSVNDVMAEQTGGLPVEVPVWNRPFPSAMPDQPPAEPGLGARARGSLRLFALRELPLVARDHVLDQLWQVTGQVAADGKSRVVLVVGEAGSGKTRVVRSVLRALEEGGWAETVTMTYQRPPGKEDGYGGAARALLRPWRESRGSLTARLARHGARTRGVLDEEVFEEAATMARWCGLLEAGEEPVAAGLGLRAVHRHMESRGWRGVSCLLLDDAQWAVEEGDGLAIAEAALQGVADGDLRRQAIFATLRSEEITDNPELSARVDALVASGAARIDLPRLDSAGTAALIRECLTLAPDLADKVASRCEGNPLFARQLLLEWVDKGWLVDTGGLVYGLAEGVDVDAVMPAHAEALFRDRVVALAGASGQAEAFLDVLHMAALVGLVMPRELLSDLADGLGGTELYAFVRGCGLWSESGDMARFDHGLLHQAVRDMAGARSDVGSLHVRLADAIGTYADRVAVDMSFEIGRHAHAGGAWSMAADHLLRAAESAWQRGRNRELQEAARLADEACQHPQAADRLGFARLWLGRAHEVSGDGQRAADLYVTARRMLRRRKQHAAARRALRGVAASELQQGHIDDAELLYNMALSEAKAHEDARGEAKAVHGLAYVEQQKRNFDGANLLFTRVLNRSAKLDDSRGVAAATLGQAFVAMRKGDFEDAYELYGEAAEAFDDGDDPGGVARATHGKGEVRRQLLDLESAHRLLQEAMRSAEELGATNTMMEARLALGHLHRLADNPERARELYQEQLSWARRNQLFEPAILACMGLGRVAFDAGDLDTAHEHATAASKYLERVPGHWLWAPYRLQVAALLSERQDQESTYAWLWSAADLGLGDTADHDVAVLVDRLFEQGCAGSWGNVVRVAGKLAVEQWQRLDKPDRAAAIAKRLGDITAGR